jgi:hypothetical protein
MDTVNDLSHRRLVVLRLFANEFNTGCEIEIEKPGLPLHSSNLLKADSEFKEQLHQEALGYI